MFRKSAIAGADARILHVNTVMMDVPPASSSSDPAGHRGKRPRASNARTALSYPRKRAVTACQLCRARKTKCDNARPKCQFCQESGADCVYEDRLNHSSFDPASLVILEQLSHIIQRLDSFGPDPPLHLSVLHTVSKSGSLSPKISRHPNFNADATNSRPQDQSGRRDGDSHDDDFQRILSSHISADDILLWPIFQGKYPTDCLINVLFAAETEADLEVASPDHSNSFRQFASRAPSYGVREDDILGLVEKFLMHVHTKNPILDVESLTYNAARVAELGPGWDGMSCLVLLACALGALAQPFSESQNYYNQNGIEPGMTSTKFCKHDLLVAEHYFLMARKRVGLLQSRIIRSQCYFWSGVYLMYTVKPVEAWQNFLQASTTLQISLKGRSHQDDDIENSPTITRQLEQRLYWSCFKSECELSHELSLPESNITTIRSPGMFPSPPVQPSPVRFEASDKTPESHFGTPSSRGSFIRPRQTLASSQTQELSWYYYLTELALRRIGNRVLGAFFEDGLTTRMPVLEMVTLAADFEAQCLQWHEGLPPSLQFDIEDIGDGPSDELILFIRYRFWEIRLWIHLPFLFYAVHRPQDDPYRGLIQHLVDNAMRCIVFSIRPVSPIHRHHGIWFLLRNVTSATFVLVAAIKCGTIEVPNNWTQLIERQISNLRYWEDESPDVRKAREMTEAMLKELIHS